MLKTLIFSSALIFASAASIAAADSYFVVVPSEAKAKAGQAQIEFEPPSKVGDISVTATVMSSGNSKTTTITVMPDVTSAKILILTASHGSIKADGATKATFARPG